MPRPLGRDRLEPTSDETISLLSLRPKDWTGREEVGPRAPVLPGTAVRWEGVLYEVLRVELREGGGYRHVLAPWDDRYLVRRLVDYGAEAGVAPQAPVAPAAVVAVEAAEAAVVSSLPAPEPLEPLDARLPEEVPPSRAVFVPAPGPAPRPPSSNVPAGLAAAWEGLSPSSRVLGMAFVPAVLLGWFFPFRVMGEGISFLVHELGHTLVAWFFGCSALPAVVMTVVFAQNRAAAALVWAGVVFLAVKYRRAPRWNVAFATLAALYPFVAFTNAYLTAFDLGGHIAEAVFAAWAFHRAVRGERPEWEKPVWAFFAFYLVARNVKLFGGVVLSSEMRTDYLTIAFTGQNDMVKVAATTGLDLTTIAAMTAVFFLVVPLGALGLALRAPETVATSVEATAE